MNWPFVRPVHPRRTRRILVDYKARPQSVPPQLETAEKARVLLDGALDCWCGESARLLVLVHQLDCCTEQLGDNMDVTPDGDTIHTVCVRCAHNIEENLCSDLVGRRNRLPHNVIDACNTCGRSITCVSDVLKRDLL